LVSYIPLFLAFFSFLNEIFVYYSKKKLFFFSFISFIIFLIFLNFLFLPAIQLTEISLLEKIVTIFYPLADFLLFLIIFYLLIPLIKSKKFALHLFLLCLAFFFFIIADASYSYFSLTSTYVDFNAFFSDLFYNLSYLLIILSAIASYKKYVFLQ